MSRFTKTDKHVVIVGKKVAGQWHYLASEPTTYHLAVQAVKDAPDIPDTVAFARSVKDPETIALLHEQAARRAS